MSYIVLARKYRPTRFAEVVGQPHVVRTILNGLLQKRLAHAYLLSGPRGIGKTTTARLLARAINCARPVEGEPCGECLSCINILEGRGLDVIEIDAASNRGIDNIRDLRDNVRYAPIEGKAKVYIIDEVHMLTPESFNALLKTLEEPPEHSYFCLATTAPQKVPSTILSRCQRFDFRRVSVLEIAAHLAFILRTEDLPFEPEALDIIARKADGSVRDGLSLLDQIIAFAGGRVMRQDAIDVIGDIRLDLYFRALNLVQTHSLADAFRLDEELASMGADPQDYLVGLEEHIVELMQVKAVGALKSNVPTDARELFTMTAEQFGDGDLVRILQLCAVAETDVRRNFNPRTRLQLLLVKLATFERSVVIADLVAELRQGSAATPPAPPVRPAPAVPKPSSPPTPRPPPRAASVAPAPPPAAGDATLAAGSADDETMLSRAVSAWEAICERLAEQHNSRARVIRHGGRPVAFAGGVLRVNFTAAGNMEIARALVQPLREAYAEVLGPLTLDLQVGPVPYGDGTPDQTDPAAKLLQEHWGARPV